MKSPLFFLAGISVLLGTGLRAEDGTEFFEKRIRPMLADRCYECHGATAKKLKGGLRIDTREGLLKGGETGPAIVPANPEESLLVSAIRYHDKDLRMPPLKDGLPQKLPDAQIDDVVQWIKAGALMPADSPSVAKGARPELHWAFLPRAIPKIPFVKDTAWPKGELDFFIAEKLEAAGLKPSAPTDKRTLIRRATFDLTGLPPTPEQVRSFLEDPSAGAFAKVVDRLLASPQYGERWGRHWLDLARYSDSKGYVYGREERFFVHASAYRDWVVGAFNSDLPYDRFLLLQLAADQLVPAGSPDLAAMGFLTGGRRFLGVTHDIIDDRIDTVTRGTMALTVACARCHDHKFDPIPTRDYYSLYGVFHNAAQQLVPIDSVPSPVTEAYKKEYAARAKKLADAMQARREESGQRLRTRLGKYLAAQLELEKYPEEGFDQFLSATDLIPASVRRWRDFLHQAGGHPIFGPWAILRKLTPTQFKSPLVLGAINPLVAAAFSIPPKSMAEAADRYSTLFAAIEKQWKTAQSEKQTALADPAAEALRQFLYDPLSPAAVPDTGIVDNELFFPTSVCTELWGFQGELDRWIIQSPAAQPHALILADREPEPNPRVFKRGSPSKPGDEVPRQFLEVIAGANRQPFSHGSGRLEMARAIANPSNPLTARVIANRVWLYHFGAGLVRTPSDFGMRAEPPSHPALLDWLANQLIESGWSLKALHRLIMLSATYQQGSAAPETSDAENRLLSHFLAHRLEFEQMRDASLAVTGELDQSMGGKPGDLFLPSNKRRSIYGTVDRQFLPGTFRVFDFANPDFHVAQRHETTVPQQALFFLNNSFMADRARALIARPEIAGTNEERINHLYSLLLQRAPTEHESAASLAFLASAVRDVTTEPPPKVQETAWSYGWGEYDSSTKRIKTFTALPYFTSKAWQGGQAWPDPQLGWAQLTAEGGHAGNDLQHAVIRRWTAPADLTVSISGTAAHEFEPGDGIRVMIVSSRQGDLQSAVLHHSSATMSVPALEVKKGETLDFVTDFLAGLDSDMFTWPPVIAATEPSIIWDAKKEFTGPPPALLRPLTSWEQFAQVLLLSNEFLFVD